MSEFVRIKLNDLIRQAVQRRLIEAGSVSIDRQRVELWSGAKRHVFSPSQARMALLRMLLAEPDVQEATDVPAPEPWSARQASEHRAIRLAPAASIDFLLLNDFLDLVLTFALRIGVITTYEKDAEHATVYVGIPSCITAFSYVEAIDFLVSSIKDELKRAPELEGVAANDE